MTVRAGGRGQEQVCPAMLTSVLVNATQQMTEMILTGEVEDSIQKNNEFLQNGIRALKDSVERIKGGCEDHPQGDLQTATLDFCEKAGAVCTVLQNAVAEMHLSANSVLLVAKEACLKQKNLQPETTKLQKKNTQSPPAAVGGGGASAGGEPDQEQKIQALERQITTLTSQLQQARGLLAPKDGEIRQLKKKLKTNNEEERKKEPRVSNLEKQIEGLKQTLEDRRARIQSLEDQQKTKNRKNPGNAKELAPGHDLTQKVEELERSVAESRAREAACIEEKKSLEERVAELVADRDSWQRCATAARGECNRLSSEHRTMSTRLEQLQYRFDAAQKTLPHRKQHNPYSNSVSTVRWTAKLVGGEHYEKVLTERNQLRETIQNFQKLQQALVGESSRNYSLSAPINGNGTLFNSSHAGGGASVLPPSFAIATTKPGWPHNMFFVNSGL